MQPDSIEQKLEDLRAAAIRNGSPTSRNGFNLGDAVRLPNLDVTLEVVGLRDPALVDLRAPSGRMLRAGWRVLQKLPTRR